LWELPPSARLPLATSWLFSGRRALLRRIRAASKDAALFHLVIDAPALASQARGGVTTIARVARRIAELRDRGLLHVETLTEAAARLADVPAVTPQRSILRVAA
jgi:hypothetical protein